MKKLKKKFRSVHETLEGYGCAVCEGCACECTVACQVYGDYNGNYVDDLFEDKDLQIANPPGNYTK